MTPRRRHGRSARLLMAVLIAIAFATATRADESYIEVLDAFNEVSSKGAGASPKAQAIAFKHNETLQHLRINGKIPDRVFQANQANFDSINQGLIKDAATKNGLKYTPQVKAPGKLPTPGVDTDGIVGSLNEGETITANQVKNARGTYNKNVQNFLNKNGAGGGKMPNTNTSIMPDPGSMSKKEWMDAIDDAAKAGEVVYKNPAAAAAEAKIRSGKPLSVGEANARVQEVTTLANEHFAAADQLDEAARRAPPGPQREALKAQAQIMRSNGAKYINRISETGKYMAQQHGVPAPGADPGDLMTGAAKRGPDTAKEAAAAGAMSKHLTAQATESYVQNMLSIAKNSRNPGVIAQAEEGIAKALNNLSPAQQGQMLEALRKSGGAQGDKIAKNVAKVMRTLPKPPVGGAGGEGRIMKGLKVLGTAMIVYDGGKRIYDTATSKDPSYEAGKNLGGFVGGTAGGAAGGIAGAKVGGLIGMGIGSFFGPPGMAVGGAIGGVVGGIVGGVGGFIYGSAHGTEMGDTNSSYWDKNLPQSEFNKRVMEGKLATPDDVYKQLTSMGVPPDRALAAVEAYKNGSLKTFSDMLRGLREELAAKNKWSPKKFRRFSDLGTNEVSDLLHCLCSASLGANPWVAQGYNLTIPPDADPKRHSCGSLANGPCMAQGFGCWRSFMKLTSDRAKECYEAFDLPPTRDTMAIINNKFQQEYEEPFSVKVNVEPKYFCPGDVVSISIEAKGGQGGNAYQYELGWPLSISLPKGETAKGLWEPSGRTSLQITVDPSLTRDVQDERGGWIYTRPLEEYGTYVHVLSTADTGVNGPGSKKQINHMIPVSLRNHMECLKLHPPPKKEDPRKAPVKKAPEPPPKTPVKKPGMVPPRAPDAPPAPPPSGTGAPPPEDGGWWDEQPPPPESGPDHGAQPPDEPQPPEEPGVPGGPAGPAVKGKQPPTDGGAKPPQKPGKGKPPTDVPGGADDCYFGGGGSGTDGGPATMFFEVQPGERIRVTIKGSDGFSKVVEGVGRAEFQRPLNPNGTDTIVMENLDRPKCREQLVRAYDENGAPKMEPGGLESAEPDMTGAVPGDQINVGDGFIENLDANRGKKSQGDYRTQQVGQDLGRAGAAGDVKIHEAGVTRDSGGREGQTIRDQSVRDTVKGDREDSWGKTLGDAIETGITVGVSSFGTALGAAAADKAGSHIFDSGKKEEPGPPKEEEPVVQSDTGGKGATSAPGGAKPPPQTVKTGTPPVKGPPGKPVKTKSMSCAFCGYTVQVVEGQPMGSHCPKCGCGPDRDLLTCTCGFRGFVPSTGRPPVCPKCGRGGAVLDPTTPPPPISVKPPSGTPVKSPTTPIKATPVGAFDKK